MPEKVFLPVDIVHGWIDNYLEKEVIKKTMLKISRGGPWIKRTFLTNSTTFKKRKLDQEKKRGMLEKINYNITRLFLPHFIWVTEISTVNQYKNGKCCAEIILDSTAGKKENPLIYARFGNILYFRQKSLSYPKESIVFEQYTHNLGEK